VEAASASTGGDVEVARHGRSAGDGFGDDWDSTGESDGTADASGGVEEHVEAGVEDNEEEEHNERAGRGGAVRAGRRRAAVVSMISDWNSRSRMICDRNGAQKLNRAAL
jgi:hypothetical protein